MVVCLNCQVGFLTAVKCGCVCSAERDYEMQFWKEELEREINELEKSATELAVRPMKLLCTVYRFETLSQLEMWDEIFNKN